MLVVDECSMLGLWLAAQFAQAVGENGRVILVGDPQQLPAIGPGRVLRDLIDSGLVPVTNLQTVHRQAARSAIIRAAQRIQQGKALVAGDHLQVRESLFGGPPLDLPAHDLVLVPTSSFPDKAQMTLLETVWGVIQRGEFKSKDVQVLTGMNKGPLGVVELNSVLQDMLNPCVEGAVEFRMAKTERWPATVFRRGDRVMQTVNDYDRSVFNGDMGTVVEIKESPFRIVVQFALAEDPVQVYKMPDHLNDIALAWCITVHKAQGGEFPCVVMPVHRTQNIMHNRNWLYTGITRARKLCVLLGDLAHVNKCVSTVPVEARLSGLEQRLRESN